VTSGKSNFESATGSPAHKPTSFIDAIEGGPQVETEQIRTELVEYLEGGPQDNFEENLLVKSSYFTKPWPDQPYSPIENLFSAIGWIEKFEKEEDREYRWTHCQI
jgi:hypothetical protein